MKGERYHLRHLAFGAAMLAVTGCSTMAPSTTSSNLAFGTTRGPQPNPATMATPAGPPPLVQNCAIVAISSPSRYACNGKVYTTFELLKLREKWEKAKTMSQADNTPTKMASK